MTVAHILGFPRIGAKRELKLALEAYWRGEIPERELSNVGRELRKRHWQCQCDAGLDLVTVGDFAWYDSVLQTLAYLGCVPGRFGFDPRALTLPQYFTLARGDADHPAMEMTKWFDTNYHYLVPEWNADTRFEGGVDWLLQEVKEARDQGHAVKSPCRALSPCFISARSRPACRTSSTCCRAWFRLTSGCSRASRRWECPGCRSTSRYWGSIWKSAGWPPSGRPTRPSVPGRRRFCSRPISSRWRSTKPCSNRCRSRVFIWISCAGRSSLRHFWTDTRGRKCCRSGSSTAAISGEPTWTKLWPSSNRRTSGSASGCGSRPVAPCSTFRSIWITKKSSTPKSASGSRSRCKSSTKSWRSSEAPGGTPRRSRRR